MTSETNIRKYHELKHFPPISPIDSMLQLMSLFDTMKMIHTKTKRGTDFTEPVHHLRH